MDAIVRARDLPARIADYEPSDWLMLVDPCCFPSLGLQPTSLMLEDDRGPRGRPRVRHLVALEAHPEGTTELVQLDAAGSVRRIQRYYDDATWLFTSGVACSLLPVSCTIGVEALPYTSLRELRRTLADRGVPSSDVPIDGGAFDLRKSTTCSASPSAWCSTTLPDGGPRTTAGSRWGRGVRSIPRPASSGPWCSTTGW